MSEMLDDMKNLMSSDSYGEYVLKDAMIGCKKEIVTKREDYQDAKDWLNRGGDEFMTMMDDLMKTKKALEEQHKTEIEQEETKKEEHNVSNENTKKLSICFTGKLDKFTRDEARAMAQDAGYLIEDGVSKSLNILVAANPESNSGKMQKAKKFGTEVISQEEFLKRIGSKLVDKHLKKKEDKDNADVTWEKLLKKVCRKIGASCEIKNLHGIIKDSNSSDFYARMFGTPDYREDKWQVSVHGKSGYDLLCTSSALFTSQTLFDQKEEACKEALREMFKWSSMDNKHGREDDVRDLPKIGSDFKSPNQVKLALEIMGWKDMF